MRLMSIGLTLIFGVLKIVNFAHGEFLMLAMYPAWAIMSLAGVNVYIADHHRCSAAFRLWRPDYLLTIRPAVDKPHLIVVFATMGLSILMQNLALVLMTADFARRAAAVRRDAAADRPLYFRSSCARLPISVRADAGADDLHQAQPLGKAIRATVQDRDAAMLMGINVPRLFLLTFAGGSALVGLAGCIMVPLLLNLPHGRLELRPDRLRDRRARRDGKHGGRIPRRHLHWTSPVTERLLRRPRLWPDVLLFVFLLVMIFRPDGLFGQRGAALVGINE